MVLFLFALVHSVCLHQIEKEQLGEYQLRFKTTFQTRCRLPHTNALSSTGVCMHPRIWRQKYPAVKKYLPLKKYSPLKKYLPLNPASTWPLHSSCAAPDCRHCSPHSAQQKATNIGKQTPVALLIACLVFEDIPDALFQNRFVVSSR